LEPAQPFPKVGREKREPIDLDSVTGTRHDMIDVQALTPVCRGQLDDDTPIRGFGGYDPLREPNGDRLGHAREQPPCSRRSERPLDETHALLLGQEMKRAHRIPVAPELSAPTQWSRPEVPRPRRAVIAVDLRFRIPVNCGGANDQLRIGAGFSE
jgi:hypothetical protein